MTAALDHYRQLEKDLTTCRLTSLDGSPCEDKILEEMDPVWWELTQEERDMLDGEGSQCFPGFATKPFKGAEVGVNLFWLDGLEKFVYISATAGHKFAIHFLVNAGRKAVLHAILPETTAVFLVQSALSYKAPKMVPLPGSTVHGGVLVEEFHLVFEKDPAWTAEQLLEKIKNDPHLFPWVELRGVGE